MEYSLTYNNLKKYRLVRGVEKEILLTHSPRVFRLVGSLPIPPVPVVEGYGYLYNWYATSQTTPKELAPLGWHVPTYDEWDTLVNYLGGSSVAGGKLKEIGYDHWKTPNGGATDEVGFSTFGGGANEKGSFSMLKINGFFWTSTNTFGEFEMADYMWIRYDNPTTFLDYESIEYYLSIRLIKDDDTDPGTMTGNDGTTYDTVKIGNQVWTASNLKETKYRDGSTIELVTSDFVGKTGGARCIYDNDPDNL